MRKGSLPHNNNPVEEGRKTSLTLKDFPHRIKVPLTQIARGLSLEQGREVSVSELVIHACNALVERYRADRPNFLRAAVFTFTREHALIMEAIEQGCADNEQVTTYVNRALHKHLDADAINFLIEDLIGARKLKRVAQGKAGGEAHGNVAQTILVKI